MKSGGPTGFSAGVTLGMDNETDCTGGATFASWQHVPGKAPPAHPKTWKAASEVRPLCSEMSTLCIRMPVVHGLDLVSRTDKT